MYYCIFLVHLDVGLKTWSEAKRLCQEINGRFPEVRTEEEFWEAVRIGSEIGLWFWLGGSDERVEGDWRWESDEGRIDMSNFWRPNQPSGGRSYNCLVMGWDGRRSFGFVDYRCSVTRQVVCDVN